MPSWLPTRIVIAFSDDWRDWLIAAIILLAILIGAWKLVLVVSRGMMRGQ
jgi:type II secretory pathway component PulF